MPVLTIQLIGSQDTKALDACLVDGAQLDPGPSLKVFNHAPSGVFGVGYGGSGAAQLALALLLLVTDEYTAIKLHQNFKWMQVSTWQPGNTYQIDLLKWVEDHNKG